MLGTVRAAGTLRRVPTPTSPQKSPIIERWWPLGQSLDLVEGPTEVCAEAMRSELTRYAKRDRLSASWVRFDSLEQVFASVDRFSNIGTQFFALPTRSRWTVLWNNSFLCDGYASLCANLTRVHGFTAIHWAAHDDATTFQPGAQFTRTIKRGDGVDVRNVYAGQEDSRWLFHQDGEPLPEEDTARYGERIKRKRMNEAVMMQFLDRLGARPWEDAFYDFSAPCFRVVRVDVPKAVSFRSPAEVLARRGGKGERRA